VPGDAPIPAAFPTIHPETAIRRQL